MKRRVVITGIGAVSPIGNNANDMWENAKKGINGIDFVKRFDASDLPINIVGEVKDLDTVEILGKKVAKRLDRFTHFALISTKEAVVDSKLDVDSINSDRFGVFFTSGIGGLETITSETEKGYTKGYNRISPFYIPMSIINLAAGALAIEYKANGMCTAPVTACASSTNAIGDAFRNIRDGYLDVVIAGGSEASITKMGLGGFNSMKALSTSQDPKNASTPFDASRDGFVMGEGSGTVILEEYEHAKNRGANIYAEIVGYGSTCDANHITAPIEGGLYAAKCMTMALNDGSISPEEVSYINAHGTSTPLNDKTETAAIKKAFGSYSKDVSISSTKSMTGHLLGASGAIEAIMAIKSTQDDFIPPTINYKNFDSECDLDYTVNKGVEKTVNIAISNSLGFGGHNATIVFKKYK